jgi:hypothetical protein
MSYFGGLGAGKGWNKFKFVLTPDELVEIFKDLEYWLVITNRRVDIDYCVNDKTSLFDSYENYFGKITSGQPWNKKEAWQIESGVRLSITQDPKKIKFEEMRDRKGELSKEFKLVRPEEPVINISPFYLLYGQNELTIQTMNDEGILGLELTFPKVITLSNERHERLHDTSTFSNNKLFEELTARVKERTRKAKLTSPTKIFKPNFWISSNSFERINRNHYLIKNSLCVN